MKGVRISVKESQISATQLKSLKSSHLHDSFLQRLV